MAISPPAGPASARPQWSAPAVTVGVVAVVGALVDGLTGMLMLLGLAILVVGAVTVLTGRGRLGLAGRKSGVGAMIGAVALLGVAGATVPAHLESPAETAPAPTAAQDPDVDPATAQATQETEPSPSPTPTPVATQTPATTSTAQPSPTATTSPAPPPTTEPPAPSPTTEPTTEAAPAEPDPAAQAADGTALAAVAELEVKGRSPKTGYDRDAFGYRQVDLDRNGCDVRNDVLRRDLTDLVIQAGTNGCVVQAGTLDDPFSGAVIEFTRGAETSNDVQIDHVVSLSDAWQKGAQGWDQTTMQQFGNDPLNLLAVDGSQNAAKGDGDTATWLPPDTTFRCEYVAVQVAVKTEYGLWVTQAEQDAMVRVLSDCPDEPLSQAQTAPLAPELAEEPFPEPEPRPEPAPGAATDPRFNTCAEAIDAGYSNYVRGIDPEYDWYRDSDDDGTVCED